MLPHAGVGGWTPKPRKLIAASATMKDENWRLATTMMEGATFGSTCRRRRRTGGGRGGARAGGPGGGGGGRGGGRGVPGGGGLGARSIRGGAGGGGRGAAPAATTTATVRPMPSHALR